MTDEISYKVIKLIEQNPKISQRQLASELGISLGKANYCVRALLDKGLLKAKNFKNSNNKLAYAYNLTPKGLQEKTRITRRFLQRKVAEYEILRAEIKALRKDLPEA